MTFRVRFAVAAACLIAPVAGWAQSVDSAPPSAAAPGEPHPEVSGVGPALRNELKRYGTDSLGIVTAPLSWKAGDWEKAAAFGAVLGGLFAADKSIDRRAQEVRSPFLNSVSNSTTFLGAEAAFGISGAMILGGIAFRSPETRDTGRDALEAAVVAGLLDNVVKRAAGRVRPINSNGRTIFEPGSSNGSFASGHATVAFAVASVVAARSQGWVLPGLAYAAATLVAMDRVNSRAHFASDVFAGAVLGTVTGRWLVHRHLSKSAGPGGATVDVSPTGRGLAVKVRF
ncbi:MAG: phosphatase PAP2 family protein [Thermoanaerobaculia bacterium]